MDTSSKCLSNLWHLYSGRLLSSFLFALRPLFGGEVPNGWTETTYLWPGVLNIEGSAQALKMPVVLIPELGECESLAMLLFF